MEQRKIFLNIKCDMPGCTEKANTAFSINEKHKSVSLCAKCEKQIYELISMQIIPSAIQNQFRKPKKLEKENA